MLTRQRLELLDAIEQTPEEDIPELLNFVHFFRHQRIMQASPTMAWDVAMSEINNSNLETQNLRRQRINQLFTTWAVLDSEVEQKEALKVIDGKS